MSTYQLLPPLSEDEYAALRADIEAHGIRVPVDVDETGAVLDGHHRQAIAAELGIDCPARVITGLDEEGKRGHALSVNIHRRHLDREQRRELIATLRATGMSTRSISNALGVGVGTVHRDLATVPDGTVEEVIGVNGKRYSATRPATERVSAPVDTLADPNAEPPAGPSLTDMLREEIEAATERVQQQREDILADQQRYHEDAANVPKDRIAQAMVETQPAVECGRIAHACREFVHVLRGLDLTTAARGVLKPEDAAALRQASDLIDRINQTMGALA